MMRFADCLFCELSGFWRVLWLFLGYFEKEESRGIVFVMGAMDGVVFDVFELDTTLHAERMAELGGLDHLFLPVILAASPRPLLLLPPTLLVLSILLIFIPSLSSSLRFSLASYLPLCHDYPLLSALPLLFLPLLFLLDIIVDQPQSLPVVLLLQLLHPVLRSPWPRYDLDVKILLECVPDFL